VNAVKGSSTGATARRLGGTATMTYVPATPTSATMSDADIVAIARPA